MRKALFVAIFLFLGFFSVRPALAGDITVTCPDTATSSNFCTVSGVTPLFGESNWVPGSSVTRSIKVINNDDEPCNLTLTTTVPQGGIDPTGFDSALESKIDSGSTHYFDSSFHSQFSQGSVSLGTVNGGGTVDYTWLATFPHSETGFQNSSLTFDFNLNFSCDISTPIPSPTPGLTNAGPPYRTDEVAGTSSVAGAFTSFISNILGTSVGEETASPTPAGGASLTPSPTPVGEVKGEATCSDPNNFWWIILIVQLVATGIFYMVVYNKKKVGYAWAAPVAFAIVSQIIHELMGCNCASGGLCPYYWVFNAIILFSTWFLYRAVKEK